MGSSFSRMERSQLVSQYAATKRAQRNAFYAAFNRLKGPSGALTSFDDFITVMWTLDGLKEYPLEDDEYELRYLMLSVYAHYLGNQGITINEIDSIYSALEEEAEALYEVSLNYNDNYHCRLCGPADCASASEKIDIYENLDDFINEDEFYTASHGCVEPCCLTLVPPFCIFGLATGLSHSVGCKPTNPGENFCIYHSQLNDISERVYVNMWARSALVLGYQSIHQNKAKAELNNLANQLGIPERGLRGGPDGYAPPAPAALGIAGADFPPDYGAIADPPQYPPPVQAHYPNLINNNNNNNNQPEEGKMSPEVITVESKQATASACGRRLARAVMESDVAKKLDNAMQSELEKMLRDVWNHVEYDGLLVAMHTDASLKLDCPARIAEGIIKALPDGLDAVKEDLNDHLKAEMKKAGCLR